MEKLLIVGGRKLKGRVRVSGSKNAALPIMASTILNQETNKIIGAPAVKDVFTMGRLLEDLGAEFSYDGSMMSINTAEINIYEAPYDLVKTMRASVLVLGPLLARYGTAKVSLPGGCAIGARPINLHLMGLEKMGANISIEYGFVKARAERLTGTNICFDIPTVTGTENLMMAATLAKGTTRLENAAREPEVRDLANVLIKMGGRIEFVDEGVIEIEGVRELKSFEHEIIPDRIEAGTFMVAAGITGGEITIEGLRVENLNAIIEKLQEAGVNFYPSADDGMQVKGPERPLATNAKTMPYPGFPTDMQAQFMSLMCIADGTSIISENIFENRFMHVAELIRMGADLSIEGKTVTVKGVNRLIGAPVMATDLRASASLILSALSAEGETIIDRVYHLDRGYEKIDKKLRALGAQVERLI